MNSPVLVGGGRVFGPKPRDYYFKLNKKVKALARKSALSYKAQNNAVVVVEDFSFEAPKTKDLKVKLDACGLKNCLFIDGKEVDVNFALASRNIAGVDVLPTVGANVYDILRKDKLVLTKDAVSCLEERLK